ncbi:hypothetical protein ABIE65_004457 [Constrictibacter sp. MBR-5]|uniref:hypothetical protein n=1 Tax=Constrictibacter sp. MBR-5 TaxID=3156467 RepID=UPI0033998AA7
MQIFVVLLAIAFLASIVLTIYWRQSRLFPSPSQEIVQLNPEKRQVLMRLKGERKFEPHAYPPLGYTGTATPEDGLAARAAVNDVIESILSQNDGPIAAKTVSGLIGQNMKRVRRLETEDRYRTIEYTIEIWHILGFRGATGQFAHGGPPPQPNGFGEPLPPGSKSPTEPRPIGQS